jgi:hypothetical protein
MCYFSIKIVAVEQVQEGFNSKIGEKLLSTTEAFAVLYLFLLLFDFVLLYFVDKRKVTEIVNVFYCIDLALLVRVFFFFYLIAVNLLVSRIVVIRSYTHSSSISFLSTL